MKLSTKTRYGVRALFDIAFHTSEVPAVQAKDVSRREAIPLRYLEQILQDLKRAGLVDSKRGPKGGYSLKRPADDIVLGDVMRALEGPIDVLLATSTDETTTYQSQDVTRVLWIALSDHVSDWLDATTIASLVARAEEIGLPRDGKRRPMYFI